MTNPEIPQLPVPSFAASFVAPEKVGPPQSILEYGETGTQKTSDFAELVKARRFNRALLFDIDNGAEVFANDPEVVQAMHEGRLVVSKLDSLDPNAFQIIDQQLLEVAGYFRDPQTGKLWPHPDYPDYGFDLVGLDTLNGMADIAVNHYKATTYNDKGQLDTRAAYGKFAEWIGSIVELYHNTERFVGYFAMHPKVDEEKTTGVSVIKPKLQGSYKDSIGSKPSLVAYLAWEKNPETDTVVRTATVGGSDLAVSKNRYRLPNKIYDFSIVEFYNDLEKRGIVPPVATPASAPAATPATQA